jgi:hypothetical protein
MVWLVVWLAFTRSPDYHACSLDMKAGIAPDLLVSQVKATAPWLWDLAGAEEAVRIFDQAPQTARDNSSGYLALLLAAHYATVATFVPTDVDARIRHHAWQAITDIDRLKDACDVVDRIAAWDARVVSDRFDESAARGPLSGHDGEWLAVRAGALGRAGTLNSEALVERLAAQIDLELAREEDILREAINQPKCMLSVCTIVAHNLGDLSRVVSEWPKHQLLTPIRDRYVRLAHENAVTKRGPFIAAGILNKALTAHENHRFLPLRKPRALRASRDLLLPIGPWLDAWGEKIAESPHLETRDRAEVLAALLEVHGRDASQEGCLRAIAGIHRRLRGGIEVLVPDLPARMRKDAMRGKVRDALDIEPHHFAARIERRYRTEKEALRPELLR